MKRVLLSGLLFLATCAAAFGQVQVSPPPISKAFTNTTSAALTTATPTNCGTITLQPGTWDIYATTLFGGASSTVTSNVQLAISTTSATIPPAATFQTFQWRTTTGLQDLIMLANVGPFRVSITTATQYWAVVQATFTTSTFSAVNCGISARLAQP